jgi:hypothetical protein
VTEDSATDIRSRPVEKLLTDGDGAERGHRLVGRDSADTAVERSAEAHQSGASFTGLCDLAWQWLSDPMGNGSLPDDVVTGEAGKGMRAVNSS